MSVRRVVPGLVDTPRGFTLVELMVALALGLLVAGLTHGQLLHGRRVARAQLERAAMQDNVRVAALVLAGELGPVGYDQITPEAAAALGVPAELRSDLRAIQPGAVTYLSARGAGHVCAATPGLPAEILVAHGSWRSQRAPRSTDSLLVFVESDPTTAADDAWIHLGVLSSGTSSCPTGEAAFATQVEVPAPLASEVLGRITSGSPVLLMEVMQARYYASGGKSWLGLRSVSTGEAITPVAGPLADSAAGVRGFTLRYLDAADAPTSDPAAVRGLEVALVGVTDQPIYGRDSRRALVDSFALTTRVALRNALGP
ncbi:MAG TPA: prepilin-type N-terminal cleavage/methylation domain-containing protein [Gemmatimonadales bacterium]|nr:prepilin-type N-terminal cleavage/methylation domain-containing protein [Gemmatimonadales bacterium]